MGDIADGMLDHYLDRLLDGDCYDDDGVTCNRCGMSGLSWVKTKTGWKLFDDKNKLHVCKIDPFAGVPATVRKKK